MKRIVSRIPWLNLSSVAIAIAPVLIVLVLASAAYATKWTDLSKEIESHRFEIKKVGWIARNAERLGAELAAAGSGLASNNPLGTGDSELAAADLQKSVKALLDQSALQISSIQPISVSEENGIRFVSVRGQASGPYDKILQFLQAVHESSPLILIGALDLMPDPTQQGGSDAATPPAVYLVQFEAVRLMAVEQ